MCNFININILFSFDPQLSGHKNLQQMKRIIVVRASRVASGRFTQFNQVFDDKKPGTIAADSHYPQKARILLMLALTITRDQNIIQGMFLNF